MQATAFAPLFLALAAPLAAQTTVQAQYLGDGIDAWFTSVTATADGGVLTAGAISSGALPNAVNSPLGGGDAFVMRFDALGNVLWSFYFGGSGDDGCMDLALDANGWVWITGGTTSTDLPVTATAYDSDHNDVYVAGFDLPGQVSGLPTYVTYFGGPAGDSVRRIGVGPGGTIYFAGHTGDSGATFPTTPGAFSDTNVSLGSGYADVFVAKIDPLVSGSGALLYSTLIGSGAGDFLDDFDVDANGHAYLVAKGLTARTREPYWPTTDNAWRPTTRPKGFNLLETTFVSVIAPDGNGADDLLYSTFLFPEPRSERGMSIAADDFGRAYVCGICGDGLETTPGALDPDSNAGKARRYNDAFAIVLDTTLSGDDSLVYSTYIGGYFSDWATAIAATGATFSAPGTLHIAGHVQWDTPPSNETDPIVPFPITAGAVQGTHAGGGFDAFYMRLAPGGNGLADLEYSTFLGGSGSDSAYYLDVGPTGVTHFLGSTDSVDFLAPHTTGTPTDTWIAALEVGQLPSPPAAPSNLNATAVSTSQIDLAWADNANDETGFRIEHSPDGSSWAPLITLQTPDLTFWSDTGLAPASTWHYRVLAYNNDGDSGWSNVANATTFNGGGGNDAFASGENTVKGTVAGSFVDTHADDGTVEAITEGETGGKPQNRYSILEHIWTFQVTNGTTFEVKAWHSFNDPDDDDTFLFEWSTDGQNWVDFTIPLIVSSADPLNVQTGSFGSSVNGTVYIRVTDTDTLGLRNDKDTLSVDYMVIKP